MDTSTKTHKTPPEDLQPRDMAWGEGPWKELVTEEGYQGRWTMAMTTVVQHKTTGEVWAVDWERALTEAQENLHDSDPYPAELYKETIPAKTVTRWRKAAPQ